MAEIMVLDACALIAFLRQEEGDKEIIELFEAASKGTINLYLHHVTLTEIVYDRIRFNPQENLQGFIQQIVSLPIVLSGEMPHELVIAAARFKATKRISFADSFVLGFAQLHNAAVITSDHHEFDPIEKDGALRFHWIRW